VQLCKDETFEMNIHVLDIGKFTYVENLLCNLVCSALDFYASCPGLDFR